MLTVLLSSYNGGHTLPRMLAACTALHPPAGGWRMVVVDNASDDDTKEIVESFMASLPIAYVHEAKQGKNAALNTGLGHVTGDLVVLTDDDVVPHPDWLYQIRSVADAKADYAIIGGVILPLWETEPEPWILDWVNLGIVYALLDQGVAEGPVDPSSIYGPNMAVRRSVFDAGYRFDEDVGPKGPNYAMGSEAELTRRLTADGHRFWHTKGAVVQHIIRDHQVTEAWILKRARRFGRGQIRSRLSRTNVWPSSLFGVPRYAVREFAAQTLSLAGAMLSRDRQRIFEQRWNLNCTIGKAIEFRRIRSAAGGSTRRRT